MSRDVIEPDHHAYWRKVHAAADDDLAAVCFPDKPRYFNSFFDATQKYALARWVRDNVGDATGKALLDVGCGRGRWLEFFSGRFGFVTKGIDLSAEAVAACRGGGLEAEQGSATDMAYADAAFDAVTSVVVLAHIPHGEKEQAVAEIARVTRAGGIVAVIEPTHYRAMIGAPHVYALTVDEWTALFARHGLRLVQCSAMCFNLARRALPGRIPVWLRDPLAIAADWLLEFPLMAFHRGRRSELALQHLMVFEKLAAPAASAPPAYLTRDQIGAVIEELGQPRASAHLNREFASRRKALSSSDVRDLYDAGFAAAMAGHPVHELVDGKYPVTAYSRYAYEYLTGNLAPGRVLELGCGSGDFCLALASRGYACTGVDVSAPGIGDARERARAGGLDVRFECCDVTELAEDSEFDAIVLNDVSEHLSDRELSVVLGKAGRLLAPGGLMLIHTPNGLAPCNDVDRSLLQLLYRAYVRYLRREPPLERGVEQLYYEQTHINIKSFRQLRRFLRGHGFTASVHYDTPGRRWLEPVQSANMLVVARSA